MRIDSAHVLPNKNLNKIAWLKHMLDNFFILAYFLAYFLNNFWKSSVTPNFLLASFSSLISLHILSKVKEKFNVGSLFYF